MEITCLEHLPYSIFLFQLYTSWYSRLTRMYEIWIGFGMSIQGVQTCGDYMFRTPTLLYLSVSVVYQLVFQTYKDV